MPDSPIILYFDLETSGINPSQHEIIQIAAVATRGDDVVAEFEAKLQFDLHRADPRALEINSYDDATWERDALPTLEGIRRFSDFMSRHASITRTSKRTGRPYSIAKLAGHNSADFDMPFLRNTFRRYDLFLPADVRSLDTMILADWLQNAGYFTPPSLKLVDLCAEFGIANDDPHDALGDARATFRLGRALLALTDN